MEFRATEANYLCLFGFSSCYMVFAVLEQLILEEFGKWVKPDSAATQAKRDGFYMLVYQALQKVCRCCMPYTELH